MKPMLAHVYKGQRLPELFYVQPKLNGLRALYQNGQFWSRDEVKWKHPVVAHIVQELQQVVPEDWILDGEFYSHGWSLQQINSAIGVKRLFADNKTPGVSFYVFDAVSTRSFSDRFADIVPVVRNLKHTHPVPTHVCTNLDQATDFFNFYKSRQYEGIMYRIDPNSYAIDRRVSFLLKRKAWLDAEFKVVDVEPGTGRCYGLLGALVCTTESGKTFRVGTGYDDITRKLFMLDPPLGMLAKVQFIGYSDQGIPLNTSFQGLVE